MIPIARPIIGKAEQKAVETVLAGGMLAQGEKTSQFEEQFARYCGVEHAIACTNGTQALIMALKGMELKGEVLVPSFSFIASATSIIASGCKPVFVEVNEKTFNLDVNDLRKKITSKTRAIMPVHLFGQSCSMDEITELAEKHNLKIIEDACQSHGARWNNQKTGSFGEAAAFSFYPTKNMTTGEGGMITTQNEKMAEKLRQYRNHGQTNRYNHTTIGFNFRMTDIAAAIGLEQLKRLDSFIEKRRANASFYYKKIEKTQTPFVQKKAFHVYHQFTLKTGSREKIIRLLKEKNIGHGIYYPKGIHEQEAIIKKYGSKILPVTEKITQEVVSIPVHPLLSQKELAFIAETINMI